MPTIARAGALALLAAALIATAGLTTATAQVFGPPSTVYGSIADSDGPVEPGLTVEAYIGDRLCGTGVTEHTGEGSGRVTVYWADVVSEGQTPGCGSDGVEMRIKIGHRFAPQTTEWYAGPVHMDVTFGSATPAPIPTPTPVAAGAGNTPAGSEPTEPGRDPSESAAGQQTPAGTIPAGSPGAGSPVPTLPGGLTTSDVTVSGDGSGDGGFPIWAAVVVVLGGIAVMGGGVGYAMARSNRANSEADDYFDVD